MSSVSLIHPEATLTVPIVQAITKCALFQKNVALAASPYRVQSSISLSIFQQFVSALEGKAMKITNTNFRELERLCEEFGFDELAAKLSKFLPSKELHEAEDSNARERIAALEEKTEQSGHSIAILQNELKFLTTDFGRLAGEVSALRSAVVGIETLSGEVSCLKTQIEKILRDPVSQQLSTELTELRREISTLKERIAVMPSAVVPSQNRSPPASSAAVRPSPQNPSVSSTPLLDSLIISDFPEIFAEFRKNRFSLLWRGSRDGFKARDFHSRCDSHANTLTVILDTEGNIFGGFTPVKWESGESRHKADDSQKSFLFTLKNPHNIPARRFALKAEMKHRVIWCNSERGPCFYSGIVVSEDCNANTGSWTQIGICYTNDTGLHKNEFFTGAGHFQIKEIEIFKITD
jgi:hypothetical protein